MMFWDLEGQKERFHAVCVKTAQFNLSHFDDHGEWLRPEGKGLFGLRERIWFALAMLEEGSEAAQRKANIVLRAADYQNNCHFSPSQLIFLLGTYGSLLEPDVFERADAYVRSRLSYYLEDENDFVGVNDNFPCLACYTLIVGGERYGRPELVEKGKENLHNFKKMLMRRGFPTEYNSATYTPVQLWGIARLAEDTADDGVRRLALAIECRIWAAYTAMFDPELCTSSGPNSRSYTVDCCAHTHQTRYVMYGLLGDRLPVHPMNTIFTSEDGPEGEIHHDGYIEFKQISTCFELSAPYHCPAEFVERFLLHKPYPLVVEGTSEFTSSADTHLPPPDDPETGDLAVEYAAGVNELYAYLDRGYSLGTSRREFHNGVQTDSFFLAYKKADKVQSQADIGTVYARYAINGEEPDVRVHNFQDGGRKIALQHERAAMVLYRPKISFSKGVTSLRLLLNFPTIYRAVEDIWVGDAQVTEDCQRFIEPQTVYVSDGCLYMAFTPLILSDLGRSCAVEVRRGKDFTTVAFYNYEGPARDFTNRAFLIIGNGFVCEVAPKAEYESFAAFRAALAGAKVSDRHRSNMHSRFTTTRITSYERDTLSLECEYSPVSEGIRYVSINGYPPECPKLKLGDYHVNQLPFM